MLRRLCRYGPRLSRAQAEFDAARRLADEAVAEEDQARQRAANVLSSDVGQIGADPAMEGLWIAPVSPLRRRARAQAERAVADATAAGRDVAAQVERYAPAPVAKPHRGFWSKVGHSTADFGDGAWDSVKDPTVMAAGLVGLHGDVSDNWSQLGKGLAHGATHPLDFGKAMLDWEDLSQGHYAHWAGGLAPSVAGAFATGGLAAGTKSATALTKFGCSGKALTELNDAGKAAALARGEKFVPGRVGKMVDAKKLTDTGRIDYTDKVPGELDNFKDTPTDTLETLDEPLYGVNVHDGRKALNGGRSVKWITRTDDVLGKTRGGYVNDFALLPAWGKRTHLTVVRVPPGTRLRRLTGKTEAKDQPMKNFSGEELRIRGRKDPLYRSRKKGDATQTLLPEFDLSWAVWSGKAPWRNTTRWAQGGATAGQVPGTIENLTSQNSERSH